MPHACSHSTTSLTAGTVIERFKRLDTVYSSSRFTSWPLIFTMMPVLKISANVDVIFFCLQPLPADAQDHHCRTACTDCKTAIRCQQNEATENKRTAKPLLFYMDTIQRDFGTSINSNSKRYLVW
ncbi:hypothetical protein SDJN02_07030, partial [Cucurbita argyrosperma subsp. argyrosperma]